MNYRAIQHRNALALVHYDSKLEEEYADLTGALDSISDSAIIEFFQSEQEERRLKKLRREGRPSNSSIEAKNRYPKSISSAINKLIKNELLSRGWEDESPIFRGDKYGVSESGQKKGVWLLDFVKQHISVEVAFNHGGDIAHNLLKPVLASELNHIEKARQTELAVIITATQGMKEAGNFDGAIGTFEKFEEYLLPYQSLIPGPLVLIGLEPPETFYVNSETRLVEMLS